MSKMTSNFEIKKSNIAIGTGLLLTIAAGIGIYFKRDQIKQYLNIGEQDKDEKIVNDVTEEVISGESIKESSDTVNIEESSNDISTSTPVPLTKGKTILDTLVEENEKLRVKKDTESAEVDE